ncbi:hypothetical protein LOTGIDRAFT_206236 [Lottia gigantea]|uniref:N-acetyl-D-glucosamine kinase n=1 Tax=Lottia gigantea TaxID=225164 RepID=V4AMD2_LOTGI|nr:hypothetical protein LOTGIDRAFT_206236 [Lottia gigantea]ESO98317.1 hypothetical protein LOTGIDRAFT_206236 [Lottia gigantea]
MVILRSDGKIMSWSEEACTNQWLIGLEECNKRINNMVEDSKQKAGLDKTIPLKALGMSLSGIDEEESRVNLEKHLKKTYPQATENIFLANDAVGSLATAIDGGGVVLIAGTGSVGQLINPDLSEHRCGGWGHAIGDEASGYWIAQKAIKIYFDHVDNLFSTQYDVSVVEKAMFKYFKVTDQGGMLQHFYSNFNKAHIAGFCKEISSETKDPLVCHVFKEAGKLLAQHVIALVPKMDKSLINEEGGIRIVCVGSVFKSWPLLELGFVENLKQNGKLIGIKEVMLLRLKASAAIGAAVLGAKSLKSKIPLDYSANYDVLFHSSI